MRKILAILTAILLFPSLLLAAGSAATGTNNGVLPAAQGGPGEVTEIMWTWTSDDAAGTVTNLGGVLNVTGSIIGWKATPTSGDTAPADSYDVTITDGVNNNASVVAVSNLPQAQTGVNYGAITSTYVRNAKLQFNVANAGNSKQGKFYLYVKVE